MDTQKITIIVDDNMVLINSEGYSVDVSKLITNDIQAVQWYADQSFGEVEFRTRFLRDEKRWDRKPNQIIDSFDEYAWVIPLWNEVKENEIKKQEEIKRKIEEINNAMGEEQKKLLKEFQALVGGT
jgi:hypothetical protein